MPIKPKTKTTPERVVTSGEERDPTESICSTVSGLFGFQHWWQQGGRYPVVKGATEYFVFVSDCSLQSLLACVWHLLHLHFSSQLPSSRALHASFQSHPSHQRCLFDDNSASFHLHHKYCIKYTERQGFVERCLEGTVRRTTQVLHI